MCNPNEINFDEILADPDTVTSEEAQALTISFDEALAAHLVEYGDGDE